MNTNAQVRSFRPKTPPQQKQQQPEQQGQDAGLTWKDLFVIPYQALTSDAPTRPEYLRRKYWESTGMPNYRNPQQYGWRGWLHKLLSSKPFDR
jgi:hypothetical protein